MMKRLLTILSAALTAGAVSAVTPQLLMNAGINPHLSKIYDNAVFILKAK